MKAGLASQISHQNHLTLAGKWYQYERMAEHHCYSRCKPNSPTREAKNLFRAKRQSIEPLLRRQSYSVIVGNNERIAEFLDFSRILENWTYKRHVAVALQIYMRKNMLF